MIIQHSNNHLQSNQEREMMLALMMVFNYKLNHNRLSHDNYHKSLVERFNFSKTDLVHCLKNQLIQFFADKIVKKKKRKRKKR